MSSKQATKKPKSGNSRNSDKRRERSKVAARFRRGKESEIFNELCACLPIPGSSRPNMDKATTMRLSLCHLKLQEILANDLKNETQDPLDSDSLKYDSFLTDALGGFCLMLKVEGDFIYASGAVTTYLGLTDIELMKCSIYEFTHPEDHKDIKELLAVNKKDNEAEDNDIRSASFRMKCTVTSRGRNVHVRSASYKVINCRGRTFGTSKDPSKRWFGGVAEVLPHPSDVDIPLNKQTFLSKHSLDLKYEHVDDSIKGFLGYDAEDLIGKSFFEFLNFSKDEITPLSKVFSSLHGKGQAITEIYRFLAKHGGWVWVRTLATVLYASNGTTPTSIVCLHFIASGIEHEEEILSHVQHPVKSDVVISTCYNDEKEDKTSNAENLANENKENVENMNDSVLNNPIASTLKVFTRKTEDMDKGFLIPYDNTMIESKEDQQDLTHLAPMAGDECVELDPPMLDDLLETLDQAEIEYTFDGLTVDVNADVLPPLITSKSTIVQNGADITDVHCSAGKEPYISAFINSTNSPLFLHSDPHMTLSPDSKSLLSPFQNSDSPHDCKSNICDASSEEQKLCVQNSLSSVCGKSQCTEFLHKDILPLPIETTAEDYWQTNTWGLILTDFNDLDCRKLQRESTDMVVPTNNGSTMGMHKQTVGLDTPVLLHSSALSQCKTSSPNVCSNSITGLHVDTNLPQNQTTQLDHLNDGDSKWKTRERVGRKSYAKLCIRKSCDGSELYINSVANNTSDIPPEILRKKANFDLNHDLIDNRVCQQMTGGGPKATAYCREDGVPDKAEGLHIQNASSNFCKRIKLANKQEDGTIPCEMMLSKEKRMISCPNDETFYCKTDRKRNFLGRLLCSSPPNGRLSLCELTRQDYEVNAPLGDNCCLLQGPDILTALDTENITDAIL